MKPASKLPWMVTYGENNDRVTTKLPLDHKDYSVVVSTADRIPESVICTADAAYLCHCANLYPELIGALESIASENVSGMHAVAMARAVLAKCEGK